MTFEKEIQNMAHVKLSEEFFATINRQKQVIAKYNLQYYRHSTRR